jgi:hypothetical protein
MGLGRATVSESVSKILRGYTTPLEFADNSAETRPLLANASGSDASTIRRIQMKSRFTLFRRGQVFYCQDSTTGQQTSLRTKNEVEAHALPSLYFEDSLY